MLVEVPDDIEVDLGAERFSVDVESDGLAVELNAELREHREHKTVLVVVDCVKTEEEVVGILTWYTISSVNTFPLPLVPVNVE